jgi:hypothetical protein
MEINLSHVRVLDIRLLDATFTGLGSFAAGNAFVMRLPLAATGGVFVDVRG